MIIKLFWGRQGPKKSEEGHIPGDWKRASTPPFFLNINGFFLRCQSPAESIRVYLSVPSRTQGHSHVAKGEGRFRESNSHAVE